MTESNLIFTPLTNRNITETESISEGLKTSVVVVATFLILTTSSQVKKTIHSSYENGARVTHNSNSSIDITSDAQMLANNMSGRAQSITKESYNPAQGVYSMVHNVDVEKLNSEKKMLYNL